MKVIIDKSRIEDIFNRGIVQQVLPSQEELFERLTSGERLRIYIGADPTFNSLHLSHAKNYIFLEELRQLGHEVIVLVGDFTAQIGDPTDNTSARVQLSEEQVKENVRTWTSQVKSLMDFEDKDNPPRVLYNSEWLSKLSLKDIISLAPNFTVQQMLERDMFEKRFENNIPIYLHEFLYPLMQGYDSVAMDVDIELCGTDQIFNALAGRTLLKRLKNKDKLVVAVNLMENPKTGELMSKSKGTGVFLSSSPNEMFGSIMAQPDEMTEVLLINVTRIPLVEIQGIMALDPMTAKKRAAFEIVKKIYGEDRSDEAQENFIKTFSQGQIPEDIQEFSPTNPSIINVITDSGLVESRSEAKRLVEQKAVQVNEQAVSDWGYKVKSGDVLKVGPRKFLKIK